MERSGRKDHFPTQTLELELKRKDGTTVWTESKISLVRDSGGRIVEIIGVTRDISERKRAENEKASSRSNSVILRRWKRLEGWRGVLLMTSTPTDRSSILSAS